MSIFKNNFYQFPCIKYMFLFSTIDTFLSRQNKRATQHHADTPSPQNIIYTYYTMHRLQPNDDDNGMYAIVIVRSPANVSTSAIYFATTCLM